MPAPALLFPHRGYYICFMRQPTFGLRVWQQILDAMAAEDGANTLILWLAGAFRSKKFPITWQWTKDHENIKADFVRTLIAHAHTRGIKVLLGFTPFGYDGVNQLPLEKPHLKATAADGKPVQEFGIGCWGWNLCPAHPESQTFMREYIRELAFDFYPDADGLFIESSERRYQFSRNRRESERGLSLQGRRRFLDRSVLGRYRANNDHVCDDNFMLLEREE